MALVERDRELALAARAVQEARNGSSRVLGVVGEAGIGKSALLAATRAYGEQAGLLVLEGRAAEHLREVPFGVAIAALDDHVERLHPRRIEALAPDLAAVLPAAAATPGPPPALGAGPAERLRCHHALRGLIELLGRERPAVLLLDDLQWADEPSIELLLHLLRRPPRVGHVLAFALRPAEPVTRLLDAARGAPGFDELVLKPLGHAASIELLAGVRDRALRERLAGEAAGNPLFLRELARAADRSGDELPRTVMAAIGIELAALSPAARALIDGAAVAGDPFDPELAAAAAALPRDAGALDGLVAADLVRADPGAGARAFAFRHPLVRRAVYDATPPAWRLDAHERVAAALTERGADAAARAHHVERFARPGDEAAIAALVEAAAAAASTAPATSARWYEAALRLLPGGSTERRAALLAPMAVALGGAGRLQESRAAFVEALELAPAELSAERLELVSACARTEIELGRVSDARRRLLAARSRAPEARARLSFELAAIAFYEGRLGELHEWADPAARAAAEAGNPAMLAGAEALGALGALWIGEPRRATTLLDSATARVEELEDAALTARLDAPLYLATAQLLCERFDDACATGVRTYEISRRTGQGQLAVALLNVRVMAELQRLDLDAAVEAAATAEEVARLTRVPRLVHFALWLRALVHHERGERAEAEAAADECARLVGELESTKLTRTGTCTVAAIRGTHDPERAIREMLAAAGPQLETADPTWASWLLLRLVRAGIAAGALADAERWAQRATDQTARLQLPAGPARAACARAELMLARGDAAGAAALAEGAAAASARARALLDGADARLLAARAHAAAGDTARAKALLQQVAVDAGGGSALRLRDAAARELRRLGTHLSSAGRRAVAGDDHRRLTAREHEIAQLAAQGHANKQIAAILHLSVGTVQNNLTRTYAKLGVRSRTQLARAFSHR